jgi:diguanylate cyclase (GGDEF)-like protein
VLHKEVATVPRHESELAELRLRFATLKDEARRNEEVWRRSQATAMQLLEAESLSVLLARLTTGLRDAYELHDVTLVVADPAHEMRRALADQGATAGKHSRVILVDDVAAFAPTILMRGRPWLGPFRASSHGRLFPGDPAPRSVAILPLRRQHTVVASLNLASEDPARFTRRHGTEFLEHLTLIASYCLENTLNRALLTRSGFTDPLTGLRNRRYLESRLEEELARSQRDRRPLACVLLDIDHFKRINDEHGHLVGDQVLRELAQRVGREVRASDVAARYGGEEFVMLLPNTELNAGYAVAERVRASVAAAPFPSPDLARPLDITVSLGIAEFRPEPGVELATAGKRLLAAADVALYNAKASGRDRVCLAANEA